MTLLSKAKRAVACGAPLPAKWREALEAKRDAIEAVLQQDRRNYLHSLRVDRRTYDKYTV